MFESTKKTTIPFGRGEAVVTVAYDSEIKAKIKTKIEIVSNGAVVVESSYVHVYDLPNASNHAPYLNDHYDRNKWDKTKAYTMVGKALTEGAEVGNAIQAAIEELTLAIQTEYAIFRGVDTPAQKAEKEEQRVAALIATAKETGVKQVVKSWMEDCNCRKLQCNEDIIDLLIDGEGNTTKIRSHMY